jgi:hypothetical protein
MKRRHTPISGFNSVDVASGYAIHFGRARSGDWSAVMFATGMCVLGAGKSLGECRKSIADGIRSTMEWAHEHGEPLPDPEEQNVRFHTEIVRH